MKMKKSIISILIALLLCAFSIIPAFATDRRLVDEADLLTDSEEYELVDKLDTISEEQDRDVIIVTVYSLQGKTATEFADDYFDYNDYGTGSNRDGIIFLISMEYKDWAISTHGDCIDAFTDAGQEYIMEEVKPYLSDGDYAKAFNTFADLCDKFITKYDNGEPYDVNSLPTKYFDIKWLLMAVVIGIVIALIVVLVMKSQLKSVKLQRTADSYERPGSMYLRDKRDMFLYRTVTKTEKPKNSGGSGGSSTHRSSSGSTFGGSSGKF